MGWALVMSNEVSKPLDVCCDFSAALNLYILTIEFLMKGYTVGG